MSERFDAALFLSALGAKFGGGIRDAIQRIRLQIICVLAVLATMSLIGCEAHGLGFKLRETTAIIATIPTLALALAPVVKKLFTTYPTAPRALPAPTITLRSSDADVLALIDENIEDLARWEGEGGACR